MVYLCAGYPTQIFKIIFRYQIMQHPIQSSQK